MNKATMDKKITKIEKDVAAQAIIPPKKLYDHMKFWGSKKVVESKAERQEINRLFLNWATKTCELLKSKLVTLDQLLSVLPPRWRAGLVDALIQQINQEKSLNETDSQTTL